MELGTSRYVGVSNKRQYYPLVKGGQGRTRQAIKNGVEIWGWIMLACVLAALAILATPGCCKPNLNKPTDIIGN